MFTLNCCPVDGDDEYKEQEEQEEEQTRLKVRSERLINLLQTFKQMQTETQELLEQSHSSGVRVCPCTRAHVHVAVLTGLLENWVSAPGLQETSWL